MATSIKISQLPAKGTNLEATDLLEVSEFNGTGYVSKSITGQEIIDSVPPSVTAWGTITGTLSSQTDLNTALSGKVPTSRTLTINGTTQDLSADRTFTISTGITIGTTAITSGTVGRVLFEGTGNVVQESSGLTWDNTNRIFKVATGTNGIVLEGDAGGYPTFKINTLRSGTDRRNWMFATEQINIGDFVFFRSATGGGNASTLVYSIFNDGNFGLNTSTNAGFKLDVNGTARVSGEFKVTGNTTIKVDGTFQHNYLQTQYGAVIGAFAYPAASVVLEVRSTTQGFLPPRMTTTQKNAIASPATGLMVYDTTLNLMALYNGTTWTTL